MHPAHPAHAGVAPPSTFESRVKIVNGFSGALLARDQSVRIQLLLLFVPRSRAASSQVDAEAMRDRVSMMSVVMVVTDANRPIPVQRVLPHLTQQLG